MTKTRLMATVTQADGAHVDRRVYVNENEYMFVKLNGEFLSVFFLTTHGRKVAIWKD